MKLFYFLHISGPLSLEVHIEDLFCVLVKLISALETSVRFFFLYHDISLHPDLRAAMNCRQDFISTDPVAKDLSKDKNQHVERNGCERSYTEPEGRQGRKRKEEEIDIKERGDGMSSLMKLASPPLTTFSE